jgi:hypothetical protein
VSSKLIARVFWWASSCFGDDVKAIRERKCRCVFDERLWLARTPHAPVDGCRLSVLTVMPEASRTLVFEAKGGGDLSPNKKHHPLIGTPPISSQGGHKGHCLESECFWASLSSCVYQTLCPVCLNEEPQITALNSVTLRQESSQSALWNDLVFFQLLHERVGVLFSQFLEVL